MPGLIAAAPAAFRVVQTPDFRANAKTWANMFEARILEPGLVSYKDVGGPMSYLTRDAIARCVGTFVGKPLIYVKNRKGQGVHKKVTPETLEKDACGYITSTFEGPDGWFWVRGVVFSDEAKDAIKRIGLCSCGYHVESCGPGGEYHAIRYDETIESFSGEHLAVVDRPRYEGATIRLNSKANSQKTMNLLKWVKKLAGGQPAAAPAASANSAPAPAAGDKTNAVGAAEDISADTELEIPVGEGKTAKVTLGTLIEAHNARENGVDPEAQIEIEGQPVALKDLVAAYKDRANAKPAPAAPAAPAPAPAAPAPAPAAPARENNKPGHFRVLFAARENGHALPTGGSPDTLETRLNRGASKYGSAKPADKN